MTLGLIEVVMIALVVLPIVTVAATPIIVHAARKGKQYEAESVDVVLVLNVTDHSTEELQAVERQINRGKQDE